MTNNMRPSTKLLKKYRALQVPYCSTPKAIAVNKIVAMLEGIEEKYNPFVVL